MVKAQVRAKRLTGLNPLSYLGSEPISPLEFTIQKRAPKSGTTSDYNNWNVGTIWLDNSTQDVWILVRKAGRVATWILLATGASDLEKLTGDTGGAVGPSGTKNINILSGTPALTVVGNPGTNTLTIEAQAQGDFANLGMTVNVGSTTITIHAADGSALSASNRGFIRFSSKATPGTSVLLPIIANQSMTFSDMDGNTMGTDGAVNWADDMPIFVYGVMNEAEDAFTFGLARVPHHNGSGVLANLGNSSTATADNDMSFFLFNDVTLGDYDNTPVALVGSISGTKNASVVWSFSAIQTGGTGIGNYQNGVDFTMPSLQCGSDNNRLWSSVGTPVFDNSHYSYAITREGLFLLDYAANHNLAAGTGAVTIYLMVPIRVSFEAPPGVLRGGGSYSAGDASISSAASQGVHVPVIIGSVLANGFFGIEFVKIEITRLRSDDFDTTNVANSQLAGSNLFQLAKNFIT